MLQLLRFYRATLCVSAVFALARCPSVCLSVALVDCIQTAEDIVKLLSRPSSPIILVFGPQRRYPIPRGTPSAGTQNTTWEGKFWDFRLKSPFISETVRASPWLLWNVNRKSYALYRMVPLSMTLIYPWPGFQGRDIFRHWISQKGHETEP